MTKQLKTCDTVVIDRMHQMLLYMSYYDHPQVTDWLSRNTFTPEEILAFIVFPPDIDFRWAKVHEKIMQIEAPTPRQIHKIIREEFYPTNAMYLFIEMVILSTQSEYIREEFSIFDMPCFGGDMADYRTTIRFIAEADAIFYFFDGERQLNKADRKALKLINDLGCKNKVFLGINFRSPPAKKERIYQTIQV